jgi:hypothetical protein
VIELQASAQGISFEEAKRKIFTENATLDTLVDPEGVANMTAYLASKKVGRSREKTST